MKRTIDLAIKITQGMAYQYGTHLVVNTKKFFNEYGATITMYSVCDSYRDAEGWHNDELFRSASSYCVVFFLRDMMFSFQGKEVPEAVDNRWRRIRANADVDSIIDKYKRRYLGTDELQVSTTGG